jgi:LSD1 subclass zinc finger protein
MDRIILKCRGCGRMFSAVPNYKSRRCAAGRTVNLISGEGASKVTSEREVESSFETAAKANKVTAGHVRVVK